MWQVYTDAQTMPEPVLKTHFSLRFEPHKLFESLTNWILNSWLIWVTESPWVCSDSVTFYFSASAGRFMPISASTRLVKGDSQLLWLLFSSLTQVELITQKKQKNTKSHSCSFSTSITSLQWLGMKEKVKWDLQLFLLCFVRTKWTLQCCDGFLTKLFKSNVRGWMLDMMLQTGCDSIKISLWWQELSFDKEVDESFSEPLLALCGSQLLFCDILGSSSSE